MDFSKLEGAIDLNIISKAKVLGVGCGGAREVYEFLVRTGINNLIVIDYDIVSEANLSLQGYNSDDISKTKVSALEGELRKINPKLVYTGLYEDFNQISEDKLNDILEGVDIILMMTDNFKTQARGNLVSLKFKIPTVFAGIYYRARGAEITFNVPGLTPYCHRCITNERYKAIESGILENTTSTGSTIFHSQFINSIVGLIVLAILHIKSNKNVELSNWFNDKWEYNYIKVRMKPILVQEMEFQRQFTGFSSPFNFELKWIKVDSLIDNGDICGDCGSSGDLIKSSAIIKLY